LYNSSRSFDLPGFLTMRLWGFIGASFKDKRR
jgi:hypothetical protein